MPTLTVARPEALTLWEPAGEVRLAGPLDTVALSTAWNEVLRRHEALRTIFPVRDGEPLQRIEPALSAALSRIDLSGLPAALRDAETETQAVAEAGQTDALAEGQLPLDGRDFEREYATERATCFGRCALPRGIRRGRSGRARGRCPTA